MTKELTILYRGPLASCNYGCSYCPFAKRHDTASQLSDDRRKLERFVEWLLSRNSPTSVFFTPWGEALTRSWYQTAIQRLSRAKHIRKIAIQTNLSCSLDWLTECDSSRLGFWCTYHPSQVSQDAFLAQCQTLKSFSVRHSVGMVGIPDDYDEIITMRSALPDSTYLWINAWDVAPASSVEGEKYRYSDQEIKTLEAVDPYFQTNTIAHPSRGLNCSTGNTVISVDGNGTVRRCHFVKSPIGNIYDNDFEECLKERPCSKPTCGCHIGYVHLPQLKLQSIYGEGILERIPTELIRNRAK